MRHCNRPLALVLCTLLLLALAACGKNSSTAEASLAPLVFQTTAEMEETGLSPENNPLLSELEAALGQSPYAGVEGEVSFLFSGKVLTVGEGYAATFFCVNRTGGVIQDVSFIYSLTVNGQPVFEDLPIMLDAGAIGPIANNAAVPITLSLSEGTYTILSTISDNNFTDEIQGLSYSPA